MLSKWLFTLIPSFWIIPSSIPIYSSPLQRWFSCHLWLMSHIASTLRSSCSLSFTLSYYSFLFGLWHLIILWNNVCLLACSFLLSESSPDFISLVLRTVSGSYRCSINFVESVTILDLDSFCFPQANAPFSSLFPFTAWQRYPVDMVLLSFLPPFSFFRCSQKQLLKTQIGFRCSPAWTLSWTSSGTEDENAFFTNGRRESPAGPAVCLQPRLVTRVLSHCNRITLSEFSVKRWLGLLWF